MTDWNEAPHFHRLQREDIRRTRQISAHFSEGDGMDKRPMTAGQMRTAAGVPETIGFDDDRSGDELRAVKRQITAALSELGETTPETPAAVRNAIDLLRAALNGHGRIAPTQIACPLCRVGIAQQEPDLHLTGECECACHRRAER